MKWFGFVYKFIDDNILWSGDLNWTPHHQNVKPQYKYIGKIQDRFMDFWIFTNI
jgi:hypothetical protein